MTVDDLDNFETQVIQVARLFFMAFAKPQTHAWIDAYSTAEQSFPPPFGATIAQAVMVAITEIRKQRGRAFGFRNPYCAACIKGMTNEERYFIETLRAVRLGRRSMASTYAMMACESDQTTGLLRALERLSMITGDIQRPVYV